MVLKSKGEETHERMNGRKTDNGIDKHGISITSKEGGNNSETMRQHSDHAVSISSSLSRLVALYVCGSITTFAATQSLLSSKKEMF